MFNKLQIKWKVSAGRLTLIIITFALGGSLCGYTGRKIMALTNIEKGLGWVLFYIITMTLLWPIAVLMVSIPLGQFSFFKRYLRNMYNKFSGSIQFENKKTKNLK